MKEEIRSLVIAAVAFGILSMKAVKGVAVVAAFVSIEHRVWQMEDSLDLVSFFLAVILGYCVYFQYRSVQSRFSPVASLDKSIQT